MTLSPEQEQHILQESAAIVATRIWDEVRQRLDDITCVSIGRAAAIADLTERQLRKMLVETVAFGPRETKVRLTHLRALIESRVVTAQRNPKRKRRYL